MSDSEDDDTELECLIYDLPESALLRGVIEIVRFLDIEGRDCVRMQAHDGSGQDLPLIEILGMLRLCEDTALAEPHG